MCAVISAEIKSAASANPLTQPTLQHLSAGNASWLVAASSLAATATATVTPPTTVSATAVTSAATAATRRPLLARTRLIHSHRPAFHGVAVEFRDGILRFLVRTHRHKGESA
jgi:3',5'-cyclic AMP phosphodiesterase CpdA